MHEVVADSRIRYQNKIVKSFPRIGPQELAGHILKRNGARVPLAFKKPVLDAIIVKLRRDITAELRTAPLTSHVDKA